MEAKIFRTKTGYCHVFPDKIVLTREGVLGDTAKVVHGSIAKTLIIYGLLTAYFAFSCYKSFSRSDNFWGVVYLLFVLLNVYAIVSRLRVSATPVINRNTIKLVTFNNAKPGLTRSYFEVFFENENGKIKKRLIMLPGSLSNGSDETKKAVQILREQGLLVN